jgi:membrane protease YdiL (CAAX protease family)
VVLVVGTVIAMLVLSIPLIVYGVSVLGLDPMREEFMLKIMETPWGFLGNNLINAASIPVAMFSGWLLFRQRPRWLTSIVGKFRWRWFGKAFSISLVFCLVAVGVDIAISLDQLSSLRLSADTLPMALVILITTPFQCAGEEYSERGVLNRFVGSLFPSRRVGLVIAAIVSSAVFALLHSAADPWLNAYYFTFGILSCVLVWRTGGLEASIALHIANNFTAEMLLPFSDLAGLFDRSAGVGSPLILIQVAFTTGATLVILWQARRSSLPMASAPGASEIVSEVPEELPAAAFASPASADENDRQTE